MTRHTFAHTFKKLQQVTSGCFRESCRLNRDGSHYIIVDCRDVVIGGVVWLTLNDRHLFQVVATESLKHSGSIKAHTKLA